MIAFLVQGHTELTSVFVKQLLLDEEQRRGRFNDPISGDTALKCTYRFSNRSKHVKLDICPKSKQKVAKGFHYAKKAEEQEDADTDS